jgi:hypothetical protein
MVMFAGFVQDCRLICTCFICQYDDDLRHMAPCSLHRNMGPLYRPDGLPSHKILTVISIRLLYNQCNLSMLASSGSARIRSGAHIQTWPRSRVHVTGMVVWLETSFVGITESQRWECVTLVAYSAVASLTTCSNSRMAGSSILGDFY